MVRRLVKNATSVMAAFRNAVAVWPASTYSWIRIMAIASRTALKPAAKRRIIASRSEATDPQYASSTAHRDNSTSRLAKSSSGPARRLKWWFQGLAYTLNSFLLSIFTNHRYFSLWLSIIAFPFQASIHINTKSARFKGRTYLADDPICIHLHNNN